MDDDGPERHVAVACGSLLCRCVWWYVAVVIDAGVTVTVRMSSSMMHEGLVFDVIVRVGVIMNCGQIWLPLGKNVS